MLVVVDWTLLQSENATTKEMNQIYRWNFDIRLGMYSPELSVCWEYTREVIGQGFPWFRAIWLSVPRRSISDSILSTILQQTRGDYHSLSISNPDNP